MEWLAIAVKGCIPPCKKYETKGKNMYIGGFSVFFGEKKGFFLIFYLIYSMFLMIEWDGIQKLGAVRF